MWAILRSSPVIENNHWVMTMSSTIILSSLLILGGICTIKSNPCWISTTLNEYPGKQTADIYIYRYTVYIYNYILSINLKPPNTSHNCQPKNGTFLYFSVTDFSLPLGLGGKPPDITTLELQWGLWGPLQTRKNKWLPGVVSVNTHIYIYLSYKHVLWHYTYLYQFWEFDVYIYYNTPFDKTKTSNCPMITKHKELHEVVIPKESQIPKNLL